MPLPLQVVNTISIALLVVEGCVFSFLAVSYMTSLIAAVANQRYSFFAVFLNIPNGFLRALATKKVKASRTHMLAIG